jgi:ribosomal protein L21E
MFDVGDVISGRDNPYLITIANTKKGEVKHVYASNLLNRRKIIMKYKVGDIVTIRPDLREGVYDSDGGCVYSVYEMLQYRGQTTTITGVDDDSFYFVAIDKGCWGWTSDMFADDEPPMKPISDEEYKKLLFS